MLLSCELQLSPTLEQALRVRHFWLLWQLLLRISSLQIETLPVKLLHYAVCSSIPTSFPTTHTHTNLHTHTQLLRTLLIFHVYEISFSVPLWDTLSTCVQSILPTANNSFHLFSCVQQCATPWTVAHQDSLSITNSQSLLKLKSIESPMPSNHLMLSHPLLLGLHSFLVSESFPMRQFFASCGESTGIAASA